MGPEQRRPTVPEAARVNVGKVTEGMLVTIESRMREEKRKTLASVAIARGLLLRSRTYRTCLYVPGSFPRKLLDFAVSFFWAGTC